MSAAAVTLNHRYSWENDYRYGGIAAAEGRIGPSGSLSRSDLFGALDVEEEVEGDFPLIPSHEIDAPELSQLQQVLVGKRWVDSASIEEGASGWELIVEAKPSDRNRNRIQRVVSLYLDPGHAIEPYDSGFVIVTGGADGGGYSGISASEGSIGPSGDLGRKDLFGANSASDKLAMKLISSVLGEHYYVYKEGAHYMADPVKRRGPNRSEAELAVALIKERMPDGWSVVFDGKSFVVSPASEYGGTRGRKRTSGSIMRSLGLGRSSSSRGRGRGRSTYNQMVAGQTHGGERYSTGSGREWTSRGNPSRRQLRDWLQSIRTNGRVPKKARRWVRSQGYNSPTPVVARRVITQELQGSRYGANEKPSNFEETSPALGMQIMEAIQDGQRRNLLSYVATAKMNSRGVVQVVMAQREENGQRLYDYLSQKLAPMDIMIVRDTDSLNSVKVYGFMG